MNRLAQESSPYLLQHANNPVDWYPWGDEAFAKARTEDKPILLSVGYSSCHWCHVMAHESFEDEATAALMNESFVNIKVDREERPDVDSVYMTFTQALTGQGGWPMTVFLTHDLQPFYAGTYFPPQDSYNRPGFPRLLNSVLHAWREQREGLLQSAADITDRVREATARQTDGQAGDVSESTARGAFEALSGAYDADWGGFGRAPKFPSSSNLEFLLMYAHRTGDERAVEMVLHTCRRMWQGGMYDHLGGGFARYSVDGQWLVPHFEKMLYDNALLVRLYTHAYQVSGDQAFAEVVRETLDYLGREMLDTDGGFYSAQDADSEGIEGKFFVWTTAELDEVLGEQASLARALYGVTDTGNFEDPHHPEFGRRNVLNRPRSIEEVAGGVGSDVTEVAAAIPTIRQRLFDARSQRTAPGLDDKVLTSWNGLAISAFAEAGRVLDEPRYIEAAQRTAAFIRERMQPNGRLLHTYRNGSAKVEAMLEDYTYLGLGLIDLFRADGDLSHLHWARDLTEEVLARFRDADGTFFETADDGEVLLIRERPFFDSPTPSGNAATAQLTFWLGRYFGIDEWLEVSRTVVAAVAGQIPAAATGFGAMSQALELHVSPFREVAIVGDATSRQPFELEIARRYRPSTLLVATEATEELPILKGRGVPAGAAAYVCEDMVCNLPASTVSAFIEQLDS